MWKKFLAITAIVGLMAGNTAFAVSGTPQPMGGAYISSISATKSIINPAAGQSSTVSFNWTKTAELEAYIVDKDFNKVVTLVPRAVKSPATITANFFGTVDNTVGGTALADGFYTVRVFAYDATTTDAIDDYQSVTMQVTSVPVVESTAPDVTNLKVVPGSFSAQGGEDTEISFDVDRGAFLRVIVKSGDIVLREFNNYDGITYHSPKSHSITWDGKDENGNVVGDSTYTVQVTATNDGGTDVETTLVSVDTGVTNSGVITNFTLDPSSVWDPTDEELQIDFELTENVNSLIIDARNVATGKTVSIIDDDYADDGDYQETWDGTDEDGDYVTGGLWEIILRADGDVIKKTITVQYEKPEIVEAFVTKTSFDPSEDEFTNLVFRVDAAAVVTVEVYQGAKREVTLLDEVEVSRNRWYAVKWDGTDRDGEEVDFGTDWKFKITAESPTDNDIFDVATVEVDVQQDNVSSNKSNATNDYTLPVVYDEDSANLLDIEYCLDDAADVYLAIYEGKSTSGSTEAELLDYVTHAAGCHVVTWNVTDDNGKALKDGIYSYKLITRTDSGSKDTEIGKFVIGNSGDINGTSKKPVVQLELPTVNDCFDYYWDLNYLAADNELCVAIAWATEEGIFEGYPDGAFRPYQEINRAEVLKVVLEAYDNVNILPLDGTTLGFSDVDAFAWYMPYVRTGHFYNMFDGYPDGTARLENSINRVELLKFVLEASQSFTSYEFSNSVYEYFYADVSPLDAGAAWFYDYAATAYIYELYNTEIINGEEYLKPAQLVERGEVALLLYRMERSGLLN